jgi:hypothetical protein
MVALDFIFSLAQEEVFGSKDLSNYWYAVRRLLEGRDPYNNTEDPGPPYFGTPGFLLVTLFLGKMPLSTASTLLCFLNLALMIFIYRACIGHLFPLLHPKASPPSRAIKRIILLACAFFFPALQVITIGQVALLSTFLITAFLLLSLHHNPRAQFAAGLLLSVTTAKPHTLALFYLYFGLLSLRFKRRQLLYGTIIGVSFIHLAPAFFYPGLYSRYFEVALNGGEWMTPTLGAWLRWSWETAPFPIQFLPLLGGSLLLAARTRHLTGELTEIFLVITASVACAPYLWTYDFSLLMPAFLLMLGARSPSLTVRLTRIAMLLMLVGLWFSSKNMEYSVWFPWALFTLQLLERKRNTEASSAVIGSLN